MGPLVVTSGRITLPEQLEDQALTVLEVELGGKDGPFDPDRLVVGTAHVETLADLASVAGVSVVREGDALLFSTDRQGDPRWCEQAAAFWQGLGRFATGGEIHLRGADGTTWSYRYSADGVEQVGSPADPAAVPGPPAAEPPPVAAADAGPTTDAPPADVPPTAPPADAPPPSGQDQPPVGWPPPVEPPRGPGDPRVGGPADPYASLFDPEAPEPRSPGRTAAMAALLVVGVVLIVGVAMLTAGLF
ncbi:hypothetical protein [Nocardioides caldifontis]|uniref:hypothetical protein n=1 Tax=Nocardioides caldifontis TaxID=2588938 RepID=UPI0011DFF9E1|nr:hypothetical protein [Nocardioides caldifontis]